jgi:hypothetical protein
MFRFDLNILAKGLGTLGSAERCVMGQDEITDSRLRICLDRAHHDHRGSSNPLLVPQKFYLDGPDGARVVRQERGSEDPPRQERRAHHPTDP